EGFIGAADAYLELWRRGDASVEPAARTALANLTKLARLFPIAAPAAATLTGVYHLRTGSRRAALRHLRRGLAIAERLQMPYDQAVAHAALAEAHGGPSRRAGASRGAAAAAEHAEAARALFTQLECRWHVERLA